jgi:hypothetical protein
MSEELKICVECEHYKAPDAIPYNPHGKFEPQPVCKSPLAHSRDLVTGACNPYAERQDTKGCGKQGKLWQPKKN